MDDDAIRSMMEMFGDMFRDNAPVSAAEAATVILDGVKAGTVADPHRRRRPPARRGRARRPGHAYGPEGLNLGTIGT